MQAVGEAVAAVTVATCSTNQWMPALFPYPYHHCQRPVPPERKGRRQRCHRCSKNETTKRQVRRIQRAISCKCWIQVEAPHQEPGRGAGSCYGCSAPSGCRTRPYSDQGKLQSCSVQVMGGTSNGLPNGLRTTTQLCPVSVLLLRDSDTSPEAIFITGSSIHARRCRRHHPQT